MGVYEHVWQAMDDFTGALWQAQELAFAQSSTVSESYRRNFCSVSPTDLQAYNLTFEQLPTTSREGVELFLRHHIVPIVPDSALVYNDALMELDQMADTHRRTLPREVYVPWIQGIADRVKDEDHWSAWHTGFYLGETLGEILPQYIDNAEEVTAELSRVVIAPTYQKIYERFVEEARGCDWSGEDQQKLQETGVEMKKQIEIMRAAGRSKSQDIGLQ